MTMSGEDREKDGTTAQGEVHYIVSCLALLFFNAYLGLAVPFDQPFDLEVSDRQINCANSATVNACKTDKILRECLETCIKRLKVYGKATLTKQGADDISGSFEFYNLNEDHSVISGTVHGLVTGRPYGFAIAVILNNARCNNRDFDPLRANRHGDLNSAVRHAGDLGDIVGGPNSVTKVNLVVKDIVGKEGDARNPVDKTNLVIYKEKNDFTDFVFGGLLNAVSCGPILKAP